MYNDVTRKSCKQELITKKCIQINFLIKIGLGSVLHYITGY